jgi:RNA polymerase sigma factor (sigma-70 family)
LDSTTSPSLLIRIRNPGDVDAWGQFLDLYTTIVRDYCYQRKLQTADVDDIAQDVMALVTKTIQSFDYDPAKGRFRAWLGTVTANTIKTHLTREARRRKKSTVPNGYEHTDLSVGLPVHCSDPDSKWVEIFSERIFSAACARIRHNFNVVAWECFEATWIRNESASEIAGKLGISVHSVYVNKSRVLKRLESEIQLLADDLPVTSQTDRYSKRYVHHYT